MSPWIIVAIIGLYFLVLISISFFTGKDDSNEAFFMGNRKSPWYVVSFGMIGASLSGVTFISVPGWVATSQFSYMQMVLGYLVGYLVIAFVLLPIYYRINLTSIYGYLNERFGQKSYKTGAAYFLISRTIGASFRLFLVAMVLQLAVFDPMGLEVPFAIPVILTVLLIWVYTFRAGIKTIIWTDTLQTLFMLLAVFFTIYMIGAELNWGFGEIISQVKNSEYSQIWFFDDANDKRFFWKQFLAGAFITITMTGLDQDMMQKNLSCKNLKEAQKNMLWFSAVLMFVNLVFLSLGALLYLFAQQKGIALPEKADELFPMLAVGGYLSVGVTIFFVLGLVAAAYSSADSALTALTTSFCVDFLGFENQKDVSKQKNTRRWVHVGFSVLLVVVILIFKTINNQSVIAELFTIAGYTYGPLLGMFAFGIFHKVKVKELYVPIVCVAAPLLSYALKLNSEELFNGYIIGFELLIFNGLLTYLGFWLIAKKSDEKG
jgi:solute:Na+ symporter, SSS family